MAPEVIHDLETHHAKVANGCSLVDGELNQVLVTLGAPTWSSGCGNNPISREKRPVVLLSFYLLDLHSN